MKITDKMRMDWMELNGAVVASPTPGWWEVFAVMSRKGSGTSFREAIDSAILSERRSKKPSAGGK